jgi:hypothetical protein
LASKLSTRKVIKLGWWMLQLREKLFEKSCGSFAALLDFQRHLTEKVITRHQLMTSYWKTIMITVQ